MHEQQSRKLDNLSYKGVYDVDEKQNISARSLGLMVYSSAEELLADSEIDFVLIATPNCFHMDYSIKALKAGKHVICEKPVTMNRFELEKIIEAKEKYGKVFTVHQNRRWDKDYCTVKKALEDDMIGKPYYIESRVQGSRGIPGDWRCVREAGGGMLFDWGIHLIDQMLDLVDSKVTEIYAILLETRYDVDDNFKLLLTFENGVTAQIQVDTNCFISLPRWHISAMEGTLVVNNWECEGKIVVPSKTETVSFDEYIVVTSAGTTKTMAPRPPETMDTIELPSVDPQWIDYYKNFASHLEGKADLTVTPEQALRVMTVIDLTFESSKTKSAIKCSI